MLIGGNENDDDEGTSDGDESGDVTSLPLALSRGGGNDGDDDEETGNGDESRDATLLPLAFVLALG